MKMPFLSSSTTNSDNLGAHLAVLTELPNVIDNSIEVEEHPDYKKVNGKRIGENGIGDADMLVHRMYGAINIDGNIYRVKTTMHERYKKGNTPHDYRVTKIELIISGSPTSNALNSSTGSGEFYNSTYPLSKLLQNVEKSYDKGKKLLDESRKVDKRADESVLDYAKRMSEESVQPLPAANAKQRNHNNPINRCKAITLLHLPTVAHNRASI